MLRRLYDWTMAKAAHPRAEWWLALFAFVEASFFPIPPHPLLGLMCLAEPKKAVRFAAITTMASVAAGCWAMRSAISCSPAWANSCSRRCT
jgi:membrane protein YqaA with SNARE-associated domain